MGDTDLLSIFMMGCCTMPASRRHIPPLCHRREPGQTTTGLLSLTAALLGMGIGVICVATWPRIRMSWPSMTAAAAPPAHGRSSSQPATACTRRRRTRPHRARWQYFGELETWRLAIHGQSVAGIMLHTSPGASFWAQTRIPPKPDDSIEPQSARMPDPATGWSARWGKAAPPAIKTGVFWRCFGRPVAPKRLMAAMSHGLSNRLPKGPNKQRSIFALPLADMIPNDE